MERWNHKGLEKIDAPIQFYRLSEDEKKIDFLFKTIYDQIVALRVEPKHKLAMELLHNISNQCWLDADIKQSLLLLCALFHYSHTVLLREELEQLATLKTRTTRKRYLLQVKRALSAPWIL